MSNPGQIYVVPVEGRTARDGRTKLLLPPEGMFVPAGDPHWLALLNFGDVKESAPPAGSAPAAKHE